MVSPARRAAYETVLRVFEQDAYADRALRTAAANLDQRDRALAQRLTAAGSPAASSRDVVRLVRAGDPQATRMIRDAGRSLGHVLAGSVNFFNPSVIIIGGDLGQTHEQLLAGVREVIFERSLPLATRDLRTVPSALGDRAGVIGASILVIEHVLAPDVVDRALQSGATAA